MIFLQLKTIIAGKRIKKSFARTENCPNRPFARSSHMVRNKLHWDASYAVGLPKQRNIGLDWYEFLCFESLTAELASQCNLFRTM